MNLKKKCVEIRNTEHTPEKSALQRGADFLKIFMLGLNKCQNHHFI